MAALLTSVAACIQVDLTHIHQESSAPGATDVIEDGIDLKDFYRSVEWDILNVPASKHVKRYDDRYEPQPDITFNVTIRRKTLFHTVNLIIPCVAITFLTVIVFHLPSDRCAAHARTHARSRAVAPSRSVPRLRNYRHSLG